MKQVPNPYFERCADPEHPQHDANPPRCIDCPDSELCNRGELIPITELFGCGNCRYHGIANFGEDRDVCLATGELILIEDLNECLLKETPAAKEITAEEILKFGSLIEEAVEILRKIGEELKQIKTTLRRDDLEALLYGKTKLRKKDIKAVLDAMEKARTADEKHALRKFIAAMGDVRLRDVVVVLDEIEKLVQKYGGER